MKDVVGWAWECKGVEGDVGRRFLSPISCIYLVWHCDCLIIR